MSRGHVDPQGSLEVTDRSCARKWTGVPGGRTRAAREVGGSAPTASAAHRRGVQR